MRLGQLVCAALTLLSAHQAVVAKEQRDPSRPEAESGRECIATDGASNGKECEAAPSTSVYVIGDIHGDAKCAVSWVNRTGLVLGLIDDSKNEDLPIYERLQEPSRWTWADSSSTLVFMGDYVDKGPSSRIVIEFVKSLTDKFPDQVTAILGNHELELLHDRELQPVRRYMSYPYATAGRNRNANISPVHVGDYHSYLSRELDEKDDLVLDLLYEAAMEVYSHRAHSAVRFVPSLPHPSGSRDGYGVMYAVTDLMPSEHRVLASERLQEYQDSYLNSFRSETEWGAWLENRPILHFDRNTGTVFVHGGISVEIAKSHLSNGIEGVQLLNSKWYANSQEGKIANFIGRGKSTTVDSDAGSAVYELLTYRGNHPGYSNWEDSGEVEDDPGTDKSCEQLRVVLSSMEGINRIAVGHTPGFDVRINCDGAFLALDSMVGRWIRGTGNEYCPGKEHVESRGGKINLTSRDGRYKCDEIKDQCEGQIVRIDSSDGSVNLLTL